MTAELVPHTPTTALDVVSAPSPLEWQALREQAQVIVASGMAPRSVNTPEKVLTIALKGRELRVPPMQALSQIHIVEGKPTLSAELMVALAQRAGHKVRILETSSTVCRVQGVRADDPDYPVDVTFTIEDAQRAGVANKGVWKQYPDAMLRARAISALCRAVFADVLMGASYTPEELGATVDAESGEVLTVEVEHAYRDPDHQAAIDELEELIDEAQDSGVEFNAAAARGYAAHSVEHARAARRNLAKRMPVEGDNSSGAGDGEASAPEGTPAAAPSAPADDDEDVVDAEVVDDEPELELSPAEHDRRKFFAILNEQGLDYEADVKPWMVATYGVSVSQLAGNPEMAELLSKLDKPAKRAKFRLLLEEHAAARTADESDPEPEVGEGPYDWRADAQAHGVHLTEVLRQLREGWVTSVPGGSQPNRTADIDRLVEQDPVTADQVRVLIADLAKAGAA